MFLNDNYSFDLFKVRQSNQFAHAASMSITKKPGRIYNPLVIYGDVGLGKTHLLHAIGLRIRSLYPDLRIICISADDFMNDLTYCIHQDNKQLFREKYEKSDCLLIDDIQFVASKEMVEDELLHIFTSFHLASKQIVVTSNIFPWCINLDKRLLSLFKKGLIADLQQPDDLEAKITIVKRTAADIGLTLSHDIVLNIAHNAENTEEIQFTIFLYLITIAQT